MTIVNSIQSDSVAFRIETSFDPALIEKVERDNDLYVFEYRIFEDSSPKPFGIDNTMTFFVKVTNNNTFVTAASSLDESSIERFKDIIKADGIVDLSVLLAKEEELLLLRAISLLSK